ncbi:MAG: DUF262 domain-containing protein [Eubacteriales bacterium]|nr:DUF262 domain-containing protein [Eubacteriales bacterium]
MLDFGQREYSIRELFESYNRKEIVLSPKFQRRPVWEYKAKSYLIDSILKGLPIPRIFIREKTNLDMTAIREIVDGQQRLKAIFDFINDGFKVNKIHNTQNGGKLFSELDDDVKKEFLKYPISAILFIDLDDNTIFDIFARLNTYSVKLNNQELLNSQFFGLFKKLVYSLSQEYRNFWIDSHILSIKNISRMEDAKLVSDLLSVIVNKKIDSNSFELNKKLYAKYDDEFADYELIESRFESVIDIISKVYGASISQTNYAKLPLFYSLFLVIYHINYSLGFLVECGEIKIDESNLSKVKTALDQIDDDIDNQSNKKEIYDLVQTLKKNTTTPVVRIKRCNILLELLLPYLK